ncbi:alpha/beta hydrolase [Caulobacter segnis]|uniref:alpha/beta hydrolase n=1 Tax=Caulobacter segnis TaxID=88688 RepID=UPI001CBB628B|nr:alpha/beta hydrolase [Caulobacter segnis]UAL10179.1 alpha/beta hydrolase [Caulobacter segnis]
MTDPRGRAKAFGLVLIALASLTLGACASRSDAHLTPIVTAPPLAAARESLLVVSTRRASERPGEVFSGARGADSRLMIVDVSLPPDHRPGRIEWPRGRHVDPAKDFATLSITPTNAAGALTWFSARDTDGRVVVYVHGFNTPFDAAVYRYAQVNHDAGTRAAPVLFTWPSRGAITGYVYDRESAAASRDALENALRLIVRTPSVKEVTVLAHSMGAWVAMEALRQYAIREGRVDPKIDNVILAAPDLDVDVFRQQFRALGPDRPSLMIMISRDDRALRLSRFLAAGISRVGAVDLSQEPYRSDLAKLDGVTVVDLSHIKTGDRYNHNTFATQPEIVRLLGARLAGQRLETEKTRLGEKAGAIVVGVSQTLGGVAAKVSDPPLVKTAPAKP